MQNTTLNLNDLFYIKHKPKINKVVTEILSEPLKKEILVKILQDNHKFSINPEQKIVDMHYNDYLVLFDKIKRGEKQFKYGYFSTPLKIFNFWEKENTRLNFYLCRGYSIEEAHKIYKKRQGTCTPEIAAKIKKTLRNRPLDELKNIYKSYGRSSDPIFVAEKHNITIEEAKQKIFDRSSNGGKILWDKIRNGEIDYNSNCSLSYYIKNKGMTYDDAVIAQRERQTTFSLEKCVEKWGKDTGIKKWSERQEKWQASMKNKSADEIKRINIAKTKKLPRKSKAATEFFNLITGDGILNDYKIFYEDNEYFIWDEHKKIIFFYDFVIPELKLCIEYNGIMYHPKPTLTIDEQRKWFDIATKMSYKEKQEYDNYKNNLIITKGYDLLIIWEDDPNKFEIAREFLKNKILKYEQR